MALALHLFMLVGVAMTHHSAEAGAITPKSAQPIDGIRSPSTDDGHTGATHVMAGCMALYAVIALGVLLVRRRRNARSTAASPNRPRWSRPRAAVRQPPVATGPLFAAGVLLRV